MRVCAASIRESNIFPSFSGRAISIFLSRMTHGRNSEIFIQIVLKRFSSESHKLWRLAINFSFHSEYSLREKPLHSVAPWSISKISIRVNKLLNEDFNRVISSSFFTPCHFQSNTLFILFRGFSFPWSSNKFACEHISLAWEHPATMALILGSAFAIHHASLIIKGIFLSWWYHQQGMKLKAFISIILNI